MKCQHRSTTFGPDRPFLAPVAVAPYTHEVPAAHGDVTYEERCADCGAVRL